MGVIEQRPFPFIVWGALSFLISSFLLDLLSYTICNTLHLFATELEVLP